jgi:hypothetical protein
MAKKEVRRVTLNTPVVRLSFPHLFVPDAYNDQKPKYSTTCLVPKDFDDDSHPDPKNDNAKRMKALIDAIDAVGTDYFGGEKEWSKAKAKQKAKDAFPIRDGDDKDLEGYGPDMLFFKASSFRKPTVVNRQIEPLDLDDIQAGDYAIVSVTVYPNDNGVFLGLNHVLKVKDGESFGGRTKAEKDFEEWVEEDDSPF